MYPSEMKRQVHLKFSFFEWAGVWIRECRTRLSDDESYGVLLIAYIGVTCHYTDIQKETFILIIDLHVQLVSL